MDGLEARVEALVAETRERAAAYVPMLLKVGERVDALEVRTAVVEEAVTNHLPHAIEAVQKSVDGLYKILYGIAGTLFTALVLAIVNHFIK